MIKSKCNTFRELINYCDELLAFVEKAITFQDVYSYDISIFAFKDLFQLFGEYYKESLKDPQLYGQIDEMIRVEQTIYLMLRKPQTQDISTYLKLLLRQNDENGVYEILLLLSWKHSNEIHEQYSKDFLSLFWFLKPFLELLLHVNCDLKRIGCLNREIKIELIEKMSEQLRELLKQLSIERKEGDSFDQLGKLREIKTQLQSLLEKNTDGDSERLYYGSGLQLCLTLLVKSLEKEENNNELSKMSLLVFLYSEKFKEFHGFAGKMDLRVWKTPLSITSIDENFTQAQLEMLNGILLLLRIRKQDAMSLLLKPRGERGFLICEMIKLLEENRGKLFDSLFCNTLEIAENIIEAIPKESIKFMHVIQTLFSHLKKLLEVTEMKLLTRYKLYSLLAKISKNEVETMVPSLENHFYLSEKKLRALVNSMDSQELIDQPPEILSLKLRFSANLLKSQKGPNTGALPTIYININDWVAIFKAFTESKALDWKLENVKHIGFFFNELLDCGITKLDSDRSAIDKFYDRFLPFLIEKVGLKSHWDLCSFNKHFWSHFIKNNIYLNQNISQRIDKLLEIESELTAENQIEFKLSPTQRGPMRDLFFKIWPELINDVEAAIFKTPDQISENFLEITRLKVQKLIYFVLPTLCWYIKTLTPGEVKSNDYSFSFCCGLLEKISRIYFCPISMLLLNLDERAIFSNHIKGIISQKNTGSGQLCQIFHQSIYKKWAECSKKGLVDDVLKEELGMILREQKKYQESSKELISRYYLSTNYFCAFNLYWTVIQMKTLEKTFKEALSDKTLSYKLKFEELMAIVKNNLKSVGDTISKVMKFSNKEFVNNFIDVIEILGILLSKNKEGIKLFAKMIGQVFEDYLEKSADSCSIEGILRLANSAGKINNDAERTVFQRLFCGEHTFVTVCKRLSREDVALQIANFIKSWSRNFKLDSKRFEELKKEFKEVHPNKKLETFLDDCYSKWLGVIEMMLFEERSKFSDNLEYDSILEYIAQLMERFYFYMIEKCKEPSLDELEANIVKLKNELGAEGQDAEKLKDLDILTKEFTFRSQAFQSLMNLVIFYDFKGVCRIERKRVNEAKKQVVLKFYKNVCNQEREFQNDGERVAALRNDLELVIRFSEFLSDEDTTPSPKIFAQNLYQSSLTILNRLLIAKEDVSSKGLKENLKYLIPQLTKIFLTFYACEFSRNQFEPKNLEEIVVWVNLALDISTHFELEECSSEDLLGMLNIGLYYNPSFMTNLLFEYEGANSPLKTILNSSFSRGCLLKLIDDILENSFPVEKAIEVEVKKILLKNEGVNLNLLKGNVFHSNQEPEKVVDVLEKHFKIFKNDDEINISLDFEKEIQEEEKIILMVHDQNLKRILDFLFTSFLEAYLDNLCHIFEGNNDKNRKIKRDSEVLSIISGLIIKYPQALIYSVFEKIDMSKTLGKHREGIPFLLNEEFKSVTFLEIIQRTRASIFNPDSAISFLKSAISCSGLTLAIEKPKMIFDISYFIIDNILERMLNLNCKNEDLLNLWQILHANIALLTLIFEQIKIIKQVEIKNRFLLRLGSINGQILAQQIHLLPDIYKELHSWGNVVTLWSEYLEEYNKEEISVEESARTEIEDAFRRDIKVEIQLNEELGKSQKWRWKNESQNYLIGDILVRLNCENEFNKGILSFLNNVNKKTQLLDNYKNYLEARQDEKKNKIENYSIISRFIEFKNLSFFQVNTDDKENITEGDKFYEIISKKWNQPIKNGVVSNEPQQVEKEEIKIESIIIQKDPETERDLVIKYFYHSTLETSARFQEVENDILLRLKILKERISVLTAFIDPLAENQRDIVNEEVEKEIKDFDLFEKNLLFCLNKDFNLIESLKYPNNMEEIQETRNWIRSNLEKYLEILKSEKRGEKKDDLKGGICSSDTRMIVSLSKGLPIQGNGQQPAASTEKKDSESKPAIRTSKPMFKIHIEDSTWELFMKFFYLDYEEDNIIKDQRDDILAMFEEFCCQSEELESKLLNFCLLFLSGENNLTTCWDIFNKSGLLSEPKIYEIVAMNMLRFIEFYMTGNKKILPKSWSLKNETKAFCDFVIGLKKSKLCDNNLLKEILDKLLINILREVKDFNVIKSEMSPQNNEQTRTIKYESVEVLFEIHNFEDISMWKKFPIFLHNFKRIASIVEEQVDKLMTELEKINVDLKTKLKAIPENEAALPICDTIQVYNVQPGLMTIQRYLGFVSSLIGNWFLLQKSYPDDSIEMSCLKTFKKRILEEKMVEDFILHLFEICWHLSHQKIPKVPQITKIVTVILKICVSFESLLFVNQNVENSKNLENDKNMSIFDFPTLCKISSFDFSDKKKLPELASSFSYLRNSREFNFDILLTDICKKFPDIFSKIAVEDFVTNKLTDDAFILLKKLPWILDFQYKTQFLQSAISVRLFTQDIPVDIRKITIDRGSLIRSTLEQFTTVTSKELLQKNSIAFENEGGVDAGGLRREWMSLVLKELFDPSFGLFSFSENKTGVQPSQTASIIPHFKTYLELAGIMLAKTIQEGHVVSVNFTRPFLRHILKRNITLNDMDDIDEALAKNIKWIIENDVEGLELSFSYEVEILGERVTRELVKDGNEIILTEENKLEFVKKICQMKMKDEMNEGLEAFLKGFYSIIPADLLTSFSTTELQILISGTPTVNLEEIKEHAVYNGYTKDSPVMVWFWEILADFSPKEWSALLFFITGGTNLPFGALKTKPIKFRKYWRDNSLPIAHTCYSEIEIPEYKSKEELKQKLFVAIFEGQVGFGMA